MKNTVIIFLLLLITIPVLSQTKVTIKFKDSTVVTDVVKSKGMELQSLKTLRIYNSDSIAKVSFHHQNEIYHFYFMDTKTDGNFKTNKKGIGYKIFTNGNIDLFYVYFYNNIRFLKPANYRPKTEIFIKRKGEDYAYSIGCIDGLGCDWIKKRLKFFFHDCPKLIKEMRKNKIKNWETIKIVNLYNSLCAE